MSEASRTVEMRITDYLCGGGLFNPELANHDAVRDLLIDARDALAAERERADRNQRDAERLCSLLDATEINGDHFTWRRRDRKPVDALRNEMDAIFGIDAARRKANAAILKATGDRLDALNRRAAVEQILFDAAAGKRHLPGPEECRALAMKLGVPDELRDPRFDAMLRGESNG